MAESFYVKFGVSIGCKYLTEADLGKGPNSSQTHFGLLEGVFNQSYNSSVRNDVPIYVCDSVGSGTMCLDFIRNPDGSLRSPKIRIGRTDEEKASNIARSIRTMAELFPNRNWFMFFSENRNNMPFFAFLLEDSYAWNEAMSMGLDFGDLDKKVVSSDSPVYEILSSFISTLFEGELGQERSNRKKDREYNIDPSPKGYNRIVFGAPGTGKSYKLEQDRVVFGDNYERVTFHPDYSFAQFVGSYKPVSENGLIEYKYVPGPFIRILLKAYKNTIKQFAEQMDPVFFYSGETGKASFYVAPCNVSVWDYFKNAQYINQIEPWRNPPNNIKVGDVVYIFIGNSGLGIMGYNKDAGVYAIAKVVSEPYVDSNNQSKWVKIQYKALSFSHPIIGEKEFKADNPTNVIQNFQSKGNGKYLLNNLVKPIHEPQNFLLLIEEINRSNVAAVFGDVFQLIDRDDNGKSMYPVECSEDLKKYFISQGLYINRLYIPSNMFIWATMNSADQGVFPMDTAFKRRWDFEYIGINDNENDMKESTVVLGKGDKAHKIKWNVLRHAINDYLSDELKINEDKQLGPYFIGRKTVVPKNGNEIDPIVFNSVFKNKVLMYLFDDAAKQKRAALFAGVEKHNNRYSSICEEFDSKGMCIFNSKICEQVVSIKDTDSYSEADNQE